MEEAYSVRAAGLSFCTARKLSIANPVCGVQEAMLDDVLQPGDARLTMASPAQRSALDDVDALHALHEQRIFRFFLFALRDRDAAASLTQDTFVKAWRSRSSFRNDCAPATWLMRIAVNLLRDHTRPGPFRFWRKAAASSIDAEALAEVLPQAGASAETVLLAREQVAKLWAAVESLPARQRTVFLLRYVDEMELGEIVTATGMALPTVKTHLYRGLDAVRQRMKDERER